MIKIIHVFNLEDFEPLFEYIGSCEEYKDTCWELLPVQTKVLERILLESQLETPLEEYKPYVDVVKSLPIFPTIQVLEPTQFLIHGQLGVVSVYSP